MFETVTVRGIEMKVRTEMREADLHSVFGVLRNDEYLVNDLPAPIKCCVDVGAHIGSFARRLLIRQPDCRIISVEANAGNLPALTENVKGFPVQVVHGACTYEPGRVKLMSTVFRGTENTGGSFVCRINEHCTDSRYRESLAEIPKLTIEDLMARLQVERLDLLKLDCEGSEHSILPGIKNPDAIGCIVGEWHGGGARFHKTIERFTEKAAWVLDYLYGGREDHMGIFRLHNREWRRRA